VPLDDIIDTHLFDFESVATSATWVHEIERVVDAEEEEHGHHDPHEHHGHDEHDHHDHEHHHRDHDEADGHDAHHHHHHHHHDGEGEADEYGIGTFVYFRRKPFDFDRFEDFVAREWPANIIRTKGVMYFSHNRDMSLLFEQAGVQKNLKEAGYWYATAPDDELQELMRQEPGLRRDWDDVYGDRMIKLVFIGRDLDRKALAGRLDRCLADS